ncbi:unnamed protein product [Clonostachys rosea f. rosea IK726]|uniref:Uncharacterized protein n=2 Tax=Clonostachys rosea f. rosea IK726 TaxID=1349383 RepID=A0ACA9UCX4_BIOOC|nr:unnamed protein product [Clonostachys rosea f. rosea IK726]CAG9955642.1 unnamed protein product [Clonostachys rosea f. rosea IK726]
MDSSSRLKGYSYASAQQREMLTAGEQNNFREGYVNDEHDAQTKCVILPRHRRHSSPHLWWLDSSQHGKPKLVHDLIHHSSGTDVLYDAAGTPLWDSSWLEKLNNISCLDQERISQKRQCLSVDRWPPLQPSPFIERADAEDALGPQRENGDASGWLSYGSGKSTENEFEESETIAALEPPCRPLVKKMATPPQFPVSLPRTPSNSRPAKIPSTPHRNKGENDNSVIHSPPSWAYP